MPSTMPYSLAFVGIILTASLAVLGQDDPCFAKTSCKDCVVIKTNITVGPEGGNNGTCMWEYIESGAKCVLKALPSEGTTSIVYKLSGCTDDPPSNTTTTTTPAPSTNATTTAPSTTTVAPNATTTTSAPTTTTPSNSTTTTPTTPVPTTNSTTTTPSPTTSPTPSNSTTTAAPTPAPKKGGFAWGEFIGGIVFAVAISSLAYLIWRFYKARLDRNYHTFSNPTF